MSTPTNFGDISTQHLECRSWHHAWEHVVTFVVASRPKRYELHLRCLRCGAERFDELVKGTVTSRRYRLPEGYLIRDVKSWGGRVTFNGSTRTALADRLARPKEAS